ncbi:MAG: hypothetical protein ACOCXJ_02385, partial [Planctomycetota bacterium]
MRAALLLLCATLGMAQEDLRISLSGVEPTAGSLLAACAALTDTDYRIDQATAVRFQDEPPPLLLLEGVSLRSAHQALAHVFRCWWAYGAEGAVWFGNDRVLPTVSTPRPQVYTTLLEDSRSLEPLVRDVLEPWVGRPETGLAFHDPDLRWMARLDQDGHRRFRSLFATLEHPRLQVPVPVVRPDVAPGTSPLQRPISAPDWRGLLQALHAATGAPIAATGRALRQPTPGGLDLEPARPTVLPLQLQSRGLAAAWTDGVLCLDVRHVQRGAHPAQELIITRIPVAQFGSHYRCEALAVRLRDLRDPAVW